ncbi:MAG: polyamine aminopropyltransferase [Clostridiales bacterium]
MLRINHDLWYSEYCSDEVKMSYQVNEVLWTEQTPFQKAVFMKNDTFGNFFTLDGYVMITEKDEFVYHDMICHPAMAVHPNVKKVLIIGGGDGGTAREVCRYAHVEKIDMVEIDERVVRLCQQFIPQTADIFEKDQRLHLHFEDGLEFVRRAKDCSYDLILVDSTDPIGPGEGLFTFDFYENCRRVLAEDGILINQHEGAFYDNDIPEMKRAHEKIATVFPIAEVYGFNIPTYASGYWYFGFASKKYHPIKDHNPQKWEELGLQTKYYNSDLHKGAFALPSYVKDILAEK